MSPQKPSFITLQPIWEQLVLLLTATPITLHPTKQWRNWVWCERANMEDERIERQIKSPLNIIMNWYCDVGQFQFIEQSMI